MARKKYVRSSEFPYHVSVRCINKEWFDIPLDVVWDVMSQQLYFACHAFNLKVHSFVLMSNHFHLLIQTPDANLSEAMGYFLREVSRELSRISGRINRTFADRFHRTLIVDYHHFINVYKYVYRNPVEAKICELAEDYKFSTLSGLIGSQHLAIPMTYDNLLFTPGETQYNLAWLNKAPTKANREAIKSALRYSVFKLPAVDEKQSPHPLEFDFL